MNENQINELIKKIVNEVIARTSGFNSCKTLVLVAELSAYSREAAEYLSDKQAVAALFGEGELSGIESKRIDTSEDRKNIIMALRSAEEVVLAFPSLLLLTSIAGGDDTQFAVKMFEKAILDGKKATVLLDFAAPKPKKGTLFEKAINAIDSLREMGVTIVYLCAMKQSEGYTLITEFDVNEAAKKGVERLKCAVGAIVTPLAKDAAKEKGIVIDI